MAQRALVIGLGSTGYDACKYLVERVEWECGGLERAPWLQILVLETETIVGDGPLDRNTIGLNIKPTDYANLLNNAPSFKNQLDLESWWHSESLGAMGANAVTKGAGNIRMVGRLALLFPGNIDRVREEIKLRLDRLAPANLTPLKAGETRGPGADGTVQPVPLTDEITVYVVGTLCGGTCSGGFIDLGYLLQGEFGQAGYPISRVGIFALPHVSYDPQKWVRRRANAWAALTELNHYMAGHPYSVQLPLYPGQRREIRSIAPFDTTYLVQPRGGDEASFETLKLTLGQFLHAGVFTSNAAQIGARMIDGAANVTGGDANGSPQAYYTFGLASVEIPGYLIAQGCCYKLGVEALDDFLGATPNAGAEAAAFRTNVLGLSSEKIGERLLRVPDAGGEASARSARETLKNGLRAGIENARNAGGDVLGELLRLEEKFNLAFSPDASHSSNRPDAAINSALPPHFIPTRVKANAGQLGGEYEEFLAREFQSALLDPTRGPAWCQTMLQETEAWVKTRLNDFKVGASAQNLDKTVRSAKSGMDMAREKIEACTGDPFLVFFGGVGRSVGRHLNEYEDSALLYLERRLDLALQGSENELLTRVLPVLTAMRARITTNPDSISEQARVLRDRLRERLDEVDRTLPAINGEPIFEPRKTIGEAYERVWNTAGREAREKAKREFLRSWEALPRLSERGELQAPEAYFKPAPELAGDRMRLHAAQSAEILAREARRRNYFGGATRENVLSRLTPIDPDALREVWNKSTPLLAANLSNPTFTDTGANHADLVFLPPDDGAGAQGKIRAAVAAIGGGNLRFEPNDDPQSLPFLRAFGGFPLAIIEGFQNTQFEQTNFRFSFDEESRKNTTLWSRSDVRSWHPFYGDKDPRTAWRQGLFLTAMAFSKTGQPGETLVKRKGAAYAYRPEQAFGPGREEIVLAGDLREVAHLLRSETEAQKRLLSDITQIRSARPAPELATALSNLYNNIEQLQLVQSRLAFAQKAADTRDDGQSHAQTFVTAAQAYELILEFWANDPQIKELLQTPFTRPNVLQAHVQWHEVGEAMADGGSYLSSGYYCCYPTHRPIYFGDELREVPDVCPTCGQPCK